MQLQRTVTANRGRDVGVPIHCLVAARRTAQRTIAELLRYTAQAAVPVAGGGVDLRVRPANLRAA